MGLERVGREIAEVYDRTSAAMFVPEVLDPIVDVLLRCTWGFRVEFARPFCAIGTGCNGRWSIRSYARERLTRR